MIIGSVQMSWTSKSYLFQQLCQNTESMHVLWEISRYQLGEERAMDRNLAFIRYLPVCSHSSWVFVFMFAHPPTCCESRKLGRSHEGGDLNGAHRLAEWLHASFYQSGCCRGEDDRARLGNTRQYDTLSSCFFRIMTDDEQHSSGGQSSWDTLSF